MVEDTKKLVLKNVLIPWYPISYLTIASSGFFFWALTGPYPTLRFGGACGRGVGAFYQARRRRSDRPQRVHASGVGDREERKFPSSPATEVEGILSN